MKAKMKRIGMLLLLTSPIFLITLLSVNIGLLMSFAGWVELNIIASKIGTDQNTLTYLSLVNESILVMATGLILTQMGIFIFSHFMPKILAEINQKFPKETTS